MNNHRIPIALMGLGWVGVHRHLAAIKKSPDFRLVGVIDRNGDKVSSLSQRLGVKACQAEHLKDVPWMGEVQAIAIATPPHSHFELVSEALCNGLDVLTEKPFAMELEQGEEMANLAKVNNRILAVMHNFQFSRSGKILRREIDSGKLGKVRGIHGVQLSNPRRRLPTWYETLPGGLFFDESPHLLYLMLAFATGPLNLEEASVLASIDGYHTPEIVHARYSFLTNEGKYCPVTLDMHFSAPLSEWHFAVLGEDAVGVVDVFRDIYLRLPNDGLHTTSTVLRTSVLASLQHWLQHFTSGFKHLTGNLDYGNIEVYHRFAEAIRERLPPQGIDAAAGLTVLKMQYELLNFHK